ncbi:hypothetical protein QR680_001227 [Steinernema hermaphroditum]|uniref:Uncharacterized protein n=1 Tax=Steinernema hermaphroditum TaxID=289476 RepID=A0AA39GZC4_9BILA|nr:hypothetical protein QR680_001227 [Steinernema hermaphroditum]
MRFVIAFLIVLVIIEAVISAPQHLRQEQALNGNNDEFLVNDRATRQKRWWRPWWGGPFGWGFRPWGWGWGWGGPFGFWG